jgi:hypothetical protein
LSSSSVSIHANKKLHYPGHHQGHAPTAAALLRLDICIFFVS